MTEPTLEPFIVPLDPRAETLRSIVEPVVADEGFELVTLHVVQGTGRAIVRAFVDTADPATRIGLADLERLNHLIGDVLDVEDQHRGLFRGQYNLEVSSPGLDRPLTKKSHFANAIGERVKVRAKVRLAAGGRGHTGTLLSTSDEGIRLSKDDRGEESILVRWQDLDDAHVVYTFETKEAPKPKRQKKRGPGTQGDDSPER